MRRELRRNRISIVVEDSLKESLEEAAVENERSVSDFIRLVLKDYFEALASQREESAA